MKGYGVLYELYCGNLHPCERGYCRDSGYGMAMEAFSAQESWLAAHLTGEEKRRYDEMMQSHREIVSMEMYESFRAGFRLGVMLMVDALDGEGEGLWDI